MASMTVLPNADGTYQQWPTIVGKAAHWEAISDSSDSTYIVTTQTGYGDEIDTYTVPTSLVSGTITNVRIYSRAAWGYYIYPWIQELLYIGSIFYYGNTHSLQSYPTINEYYSDWALNPATTSSWTWNDVSTMEIGVKGHRAYNAYVFCTKVYMVISYDVTLAKSGGIAIGPAMII
jgi:hypothetical protein